MKCQASAGSCGLGQRSADSRALVIQAAGIVAADAAKVEPGRRLTWPGMNMCAQGALTGDAEAALS